MANLQKKCLAASAFTHGLLVLLLVIGSAFITRQPPEITPSFELVDLSAMLVDTPNVVGGGNPNASLPPAPAPEPIRPVEPAAPPAVQPRPQPEPAAPPPEAKPEPKPEPVKLPEPVKPPEIKPDRLNPDSFKISEKAIKKEKPPEKAPEKTAEKAPEKTKPEPSFDLGKAEKRVIKPTATKNNEAAATQAEAQKEQQMASARRGAAVTEALSRVKGGLSTVGGTYDIPGPGGAAYASYHLALRKIYEEAWIPPQAARDNEPIVEVEVVIARDGTVLSRRITKKSGRAELDRTVQKTLDRVNKVPPFPSGSTDEKRTFRINFNLTDKLG